MDLTAANIELLVNSFYQKVQEDDLIGPKFSHVDFEKHLPKMIDFWSTIIFSKGTYAGNPFNKHIPLGLKTKHFNRWLQLFEETVEEHFEGESAQEIIKRANSISLIFQHKLRSLELEP